VLTWLSFFQIVAIAIIAGLVWFQLNNQEEDIMDKQGLLFFVVTFWSFYGWFNALYTFPPERAVLNKERASGAYRLSAYFVAKTCTDTPVEFILPSIFIIILYWMTGLNTSPERFFTFWSVMLISNLMGTSFGLLISTIIKNTQRAVALSSVLLLSMMLLGGFFAASATIPVWISWVQWISFIKYSYEALLINEFASNEHYTPSNPSKYSERPITGTAILDKAGVMTELWWDVLVLVGMIVVARLVAYFILRIFNKPRK